MKTLNLTLRTILLTLVLVSTATSALAYDMYVNGIYYNIYGNEARVTFSSYNSSTGTYYSNYSGHITIPEKISYNGLTYSVTGIEGCAFYNCANLTSISIPNTVITIGACSFYGCSNLTSVAIPNSVILINSQAFSKCKKLTSINIPNSVIEVGGSAFDGCSKLTNAFIGNSVADIGSNVFSSSPLSYVTCLAETPPSLNSSSYYFNSYVNTTLYVPVSSIEAYSAAAIWKNFKIITDFKPNYLSLDDVSVMHGDTIVVPVMMENENEITAFQTDIYMVNGFEVIKEENDEYHVELSGRKGRDHVIMASETPDGAIRVASYSPTLKTYRNNEGELFYITVKVPEDGNGVYPFILKNIRLTTVDEDEVLSPDAFCNIAVAPFIKGDANESGEVTVTDVVVTAKYILFQNPEPFNLEAADMNGDGKITITDVVKIANLVLDQDYPEPETSRMMAPNNAGDSMSGELFNNTVSINLDNEMDYTALQLNLTLPEGMTASEFAMSERASDLGLIVKDRGNGKVRILAYSPNLKTIMGNEGSVLTFNVDDMKGDIKVDCIELVTPNGESVHLNGFKVAANQLTALNETTAGKTIADVKYFNLAGQCIAEPAAGVTLVVTTYTDGSRTTNKVIR